MRIKILELDPNIQVYRKIQNCNRDDDNVTGYPIDISRSSNISAGIDPLPAKRQTIPKGSNRKVTKCALRHVSVVWIDERKRRHENRVDNPTSICEISITI